MSRSQPKKKQPWAQVSSGGQKKPGSLIQTSEAKAPTEEPYDRAEVFSRTPVWRFSEVDHEGGWSFDVIDGPTLVGLLQKLSDFESMTIREVFYSGEEPGKEYDVPSLPGDTLRRLEELGRDDETKLARLRLAGRIRLYGFLRQHVFHVLWWDPEHTVYPSKKRNT